MLERQLRRWTVGVLREVGADPVSVENPVGPGTPDVNYIGGWIELKVLPDWPKRPKTPVRMRHFTVQQRAWLRRRIHCGGRAHVLIGVGRRERILLDGAVAARNLGDATKSGLISVATSYWKRQPSAEEFYEALCKQG